MTPGDLSAPADRFTLPQPGAPTPVRFPPITRSTLENGVRIWSMPHTAIPVVSVALVVDAGAAQDPATRHGLASLTAHLSEEGAGGQDAIQLAETLARLGTHLDVDAGPDVTTVSFTSLRRFFEPALRVLADVVTRPHFHEPDLVRVRELRLNRLRQLSRSPATPADRAYLASVFGAHPYGHGVLGTTKSVGAITLDEVRAFHRSAWRPNAATLIVAGEIEHDLVVQTARALLGGWTRPRGSNPENQNSTPEVVSAPAVPLPAGRAHEILLVERPGAPQSELRIGHLAASRRTPDYAPLLVMNAILGGQFTSRVNMKLREEKAYTYGARTSFDWKRGLAPFALSTSVHTASTAAAIADASAEIEGIRGSRPVTEHELSHAKAALTRGYPAGFETAAQVARAVSQLALYDLPDTYFSDFVPTVGAVTAAEVTRVAAQYLDPARLTALVVGDAQVVADSLHTLSFGEPLQLPEAERV